MGNGLWHFARNFLGNISTPPDCQQRDTGRDEITASWAHIHWGCPDLMGANLLPLAESESHSCGMPKPITHARPFNQGLYKGLDIAFIIIACAGFIREYYNIKRIDKI